MKKSVFPLAIASLFLFSVVSSGCSKADETAGAPTKEEIDKGLSGKPGIDPKDSAPMGAKGGS